ncbi:MAG: ribosome small subunit-dependent GTPase A [Taibaiella sp.]|nr:ribosome small subunit-dependent GTPase A [Taibaiella sp.]
MQGDKKRTTGRIYRSTGSWYQVLGEDGNWWNARIKGKLKIDTDISSSNPVAVGDNVVFEIEDKETAIATIKTVKPRNNYIVRVSPHNRNQKHIIAANLDLAVIIVTIAEPRTSNGFIDRFLLTAEAYHIPAAIVINKTDLLDDSHQEQLKHWQDMYGKAGYPVFPIVALQPDTIKIFKETLSNRITLISGHSGVGKSTLINQLLPDLELRTSEVSEWSGKGMHTTTFAEMFDMPTGNGAIIDTPGVKEFGLIDISKEELAHYFPEIRSVMSGCRFNNCLHINEPDCAVKTAVIAGDIASDRYISYVNILETIDTKW